MHVSRQVCVECGTLMLEVKWFTKGVRKGTRWVGSSQACLVDGTA